MRSTACLLALLPLLCALPANAQPAPPAGAAPPGPAAPPPVAAPVAPAPYAAGPAAGYAPPPPWMAPPPWGYAATPATGDGTARRSTGMMVTGIVLSSVGVTNVALGALAIATAPEACLMTDESTSDFGGSSGDGCFKDPAFVVGGGAMMVGGGVLLAVGVPLWIVGASKPEHAPRAVPAIAVGPRGGSATWRF